MKGNYLSAAKLWPLWLQAACISFLITPLFIFCHSSQIIRFWITRMPLRRQWAEDSVSTKSPATPVTPCTTSTGKLPQIKGWVQLRRAETTWNWWPINYYIKLFLKQQWQTLPSSSFQLCGFVGFLCHVMNECWTVDQTKHKFEYITLNSS